MTEDEDEATAIKDFLYQIIMRETTSDIGIQVEFTLPLQAKIPLSREDRLGRKDFPIPISMFYGTVDWVMAVDGHALQKIVDNNE